MADARAVLRYVEEHTDLSVLAVTDHDDVGGALVAREEHARGSFSFELVTGIEVTTLAGHLLALWVDEPLRSFRSLPATIEAIHRAGGLAVVPHPFSMATRSVGRRALEAVLAIEDSGTHPDGLEVANPTLAGALTGNRPRALNRGRYALAETGGSDAHFLDAIGSGVTIFAAGAGAPPAGALRAAIEERASYGTIRRAPSLRQLGPRRIAMQQVIGLSTTPRKVLGPPLTRFASRFRVPGGVR
ncbi:MAG: PHP-associated domain-containing protein [Dehalococcoidia bacterium]